VNWQRHLPPAKRIAVAYNAWGEPRQARLADLTRFAPLSYSTDNWLIPVTSIALLESEGNCTRVCFDGNRPLVRTPLQRLEGRLDPAVFFRASRSHVVNLRFVERIDPAVNDGLIVHRRTVGEVPVSRRQARRLPDAWSIDR